MKMSRASSCSDVSRTKTGFNVAITGGSGSLASHIAKLVYSHWKDVQEIRLFDRIPPQQSLITSITGFATTSDKPKVSYYPGDLLKSDDLLTAFVKVDVVIHCAAAVENGSVLTRREMKKVNVDGTRNVIQACLDCGVTGLVFSGSLAQVLRTNIKLMAIDESTELPKGSGDFLYPYYGGTKGAAEKLVLEANGRCGKDRVQLNTCSLRLPVMFGENDKLFVPAALKASKSCFGFLIPVGYTRATMQSLYFGNGAWAHIAAAQRLLDRDTQPVVGGKLYYIGDYSPVTTMTNFQTQFLKPLGYRVFPLKIPLFLMLVLAYFIEFLVILLAVVRIDFRTNLNRSSMRYLKLSHSYSWEKARKELQYEPLFSNTAAVARSVEYYRQFL